MVNKKLTGIFDCGRRLCTATVSRRSLSFCAALSLTCVTAVSADDTEIYFTGLVDEFPNVLFVLDRSGSMGNTGSSGATRLEELQSALRGFVTEAEGINVGIMTYSLDATLEEPLAAIEDNRDAVNQAVEDIVPQGRTSTLRALDAARRYFSGELAVDVEVPGTVILPGNTEPEPVVESRILPSPITHECQVNHIVLLTDGSPSPDLDLAAELEQDVLGGACLQQNVPGQSAANSIGNGNCGAELAQYISKNDLLPDSLSGDNVVTTHTIGFNFEDPWLATLSSEVTGGGGTHFNVESINELKNALDDVFNSVTTARFAAPTVSTDSFNESRHRDELFFAQFKPSNRVRWTGNIKKYRLASGVILDENGDALLNDAGEEATEPRIVDADGNPVVDDAGNTVISSRSFWSDAPDGAAVADGGFAGNLTPYEDRFWYTDFNVTPDANGIIEPVRVTENNRGIITEDVLQAGSVEERDELMSWALAPEVPFDNNTTRSYVGDSLHGTPQLLTYNASTATDPNERTEVLYAATNQGVLHAIDADTGEEIWSYSPVEHLPNIRKYFRNAKTRKNRVYGLDGDLVIDSTRIESLSYDFELSRARLFMTERRGGNRVYGLDITNGHNSVDPFKVMWKITGGVAPFQNLAQTWSRPELINVRYGCPDDCEERELLMFSGGYNASEYDDVDLNYASIESNVPESDHGNAVYLVDPDTGELVWSVGNGTHHSLDLPMAHSIPSTPVPVDTNLDGFVDLLFFVDISGDIWRVDLSKQDSAQGVVHVSGGQIAALNPAGQSLRFFNPLDVSISGFNFSTSNFYLVTGSGMRNSPLFPEPDNNRLYAIADRWTQRVPFRVDPVTNENVTDYNYVTRNDGSHTIITADDNIIRNVDDATSTTSVFHGFYRSLPPGEKVLVPTSTRSSRVLSSSYVPPTVATEGCAGPIGSSRLYILALPDGENVVPENLGEGYIEVGEGIQGSGVLIDTGKGNAPHLLFDTKPKTFKDVIVGVPETYRKIQRTGWVERDGY